MSEIPVAITMGDPAGIGPEIVVKAIGARAWTAITPVVVGNRDALKDAGAICSVDVRWHLADQDQDEFHPLPEMQAWLVNPTDEIDWPVRRGVVDAAHGRAGYSYLSEAVRLALGGAVGAVVTGPLNKESLSEAGWVGVGHTALLASMCGVESGSVAMMLASESLRVVHVTTHVPLREAVDLVTKDRVVMAIHLASAGIGAIVGRLPRLAVAGLNPHSGENGLFGSEELEVITPAIDICRAGGLDVTGPVSPDTVFLWAAQGRFDGVVAQYHDQGHIPAKFAGFADTVNVTLGLPIIRTSVDHGTAFDIAGRGVADEANLVSAIRLAAQMAEQPGVP